MATVKSWIYTQAGYPETLRFHDSNVPPKPSPNHLLVHVKAAALNPVDIQLMNLDLNSIPGLNGPKIVGKDFASVVLDTAPDSQFDRGDEIMGVTMARDGSGTLTEVAHIDLNNSAIVKKPVAISWMEAASLPLVWLTACTAIEEVAPYMRNQPEKKLAILGGSSATGIYMIQIARKRGWRILSTCSGRNVEFVRQLGAEHIVDYTKASDAVKSAVSCFQANAIIDCVGGTECIGLVSKYVIIIDDKTSRSSMGSSFLYLTTPRMVVRRLLGYLGLWNSYSCIILKTRKD